MGWEIYPDGLYDMLTRLKRDYNDPILYVTENGAAFDDKVEKNGKIQDDDRVRFLRDHMITAKQAIQDGVKLEAHFPLLEKSYINTAREVALNSRCVKWQKRR